MNATTGETVQEGFQHYLREGHFLALQPESATVSLTLYRRLGDGVPVGREELADGLGLSRTAIDAFIDRTPASAIDVDREGRVIAFGGLSLVEANHAFIVEGKKLHTWCVFDGLFLPQLLGKLARVITRCPTTDIRIEVELEPTRVARATPPDPVMSLVAPNRDACCENLRGAFCNHVNFFADEAAFRSWAADRTDITCVSLEVAHRLALQRNRLRYEGFLGPA